MLSGVNIGLPMTTAVFYLDVILTYLPRDLQSSNSTLGLNLLVFTCLGLIKVTLFQKLLQNETGKSATIMFEMCSNGN